jgi:hypothetical protein
VPLPTKAKTWLYDVNVVYATTGDALTDHRQLLRGLKDSLKGFAGGWTHVASSNGSSTSTSTDLWGTNADLVWDETGNAHSWIVLAQTGLASTFQLLIDLNNGSWTNLTMAFTTSSGGFTGGSTTAAPDDATNKVTLLTAATQSWISGLATARAHAWQSNDGQCTRVVVYVSNLPVLFWLFDRASGGVSGWSPAVFAAVSQATSNVLRYADWWASASWVHGRTSGGVANAYLSCEGMNGGGLGETILVANELDSAWPFLPIGIVSNTPGSRGRLGTVYDLWYGSTAIGHGDTYPDDSTRQFAQFGHLIFPWNGTAPQTS